jgi:CheY-like chemotaxis protein
MAPGDASRLRQIVWNVLQNAVDFTPAGGRVDLRLHLEASFAQITVSDSGVDISPDGSPHLFERCWQADSTNTRRHGGLGLGLAIVRELVGLHGGTVFANSPGESKGTTVMIRFPSRHAPMTDALGNPTVRTEAARAAHMPPPGRLRGVRVLLVEDDNDSREVMGIVLKRYGAEVVEASSVPEALEQVRLSVPDVLISDIGMPEEDGYSLLRKLRALPDAEGGRVPALAVTAFARKEDHDRALLNGFQLHMTKPISPAALSAAVAQLADRS